MKEKRLFLRCPLCGNLVEMVNDSGVTPVCCGQPMMQLTANTADAALEKHVPAAERKGNEIHVQVGSIAHPMVEEHYIEWIAIVGERYTQRVALKPGEAPQAVFIVANDEPVTVYAYCNLHSLWAAEI